MGRGRSLAVETHPELLDNDGLPGLDIVVLKNDEQAEVLNEVNRNGPPINETWLDPVTQFLDLPSVKLRIVYGDEFYFDGSFDQNEDLKLVEAIDDAIVKRESLRNG